MADKAVKWTLFGDDGPFQAAMGRVSQTLKQTDGHVQGLFGGLSAPFGKLMGLFGAMTAVLAGGKIFSESVSATKEFTGEANKLARVLGTNATEASALNVALGDIYSDADTFAGAASKLAKELRTNEDGLRGMGLQTRDARGELRRMKDLMMDSIAIINSYKDGSDKLIATQKIFGKGAEEVTSLLKLNNAVLEEARKKQEELGLTVTKENVESLKAYKAAMNDAGDVLLAVKKVIGDAIMPVLTKLANWWSAIGPAAVTVVKGAIGGLVATFWALYNGVNIVWQTLDAMVFTIAEPLLSLGRALVQLADGDFKGAVKTMSSWPDRVAERWKAAGASMVESSEDTLKRISELFLEGTPAATQDQSGKKTMGKDPDTAKSLMAGFEAELALLKQHHANKNAAEGTFYEFSKERELAFWKGKAAITQAGTKDAFAIQGKITAATLDIQKDAFETRLAQLRREQEATEQNFAGKQELARQELALVTQRYGAESKQAQDAAKKIEEIQRQARDQKRALRTQELAELQAATDAAIEIARQDAQLRLDLGLITKDRMLQLERQFEEQRHQVALVAARERLAMADPTLNPVEYAKLKAEIEQLERQHQVRMGQLGAAATLEQQRNWMSFFGSLESGFGSVINGFLNGTRTIAQTIRGLFAAVGQSIAATLAQMAARWLVQQIAQRVLGRVTAASQVAANAAVAGSAAFASTAAIPIFGPELAPAAAAAAYAGAMGFLATIPAAAKGFDIPAGVNPVTQLHEKEMVLPAEQADVIRRMAGGGGEGGDLHVHVQGQSVGDFFLVHKAQLAKALKSAYRDGHLTGKG